MRSVLLGLALLAAPPALAQQTETQRLNACMDKIETDPEGAYEDGLGWMQLGARPAARHCVALALIALGQKEEGALQLEELANAKDAGGLDARALYLTQAGNAWLLAGAPEAAIVTLTNALKLKPRDAALFVDRARAHMTMKKWDLAVKDIDTAVQLSPGDAEALRMRAKSLMEQGKLEAAWQDVRAAMQLQPSDTGGLVLRGEVREAFHAKGLPDPAETEPQVTASAPRPRPADATADRPVIVGE